MEKLRKVLGKDKNGNDVFETDWLIEDGGDFAYLFQLEGRKPVVKASWTCGSLGLIDFPAYVDRVVNGDAPECSKEHTRKTNERVTNLKISDLEVVPERLRGYLNQLNPNGKAFWAMEGTVKRPRPYDEPYGTLRPGVAEDF